MQGERNQPSVKANSPEVTLFPAEHGQKINQHDFLIFAHRDIIARFESLSALCDSALVSDI